MKGLLVRLAGGYAGLGALVYLIHRARYHGMSELREWTDTHSRRIERELDGLRGELEALRRDLRRPGDGRATGAHGGALAEAEPQAQARAGQTAAMEPETITAPKSSPRAAGRARKNRRPNKGAPVEERLAA